MIYGRSSHCLCYLNGNIYAVGGFLTGQVFTDFCERLVISKNQWEMVAPLNYKCVAASLCSFNNKFLFKFGGLIDGGLLNNQIEKYDELLNKWTVIDATFDPADSLKANLKEFRLLSASCSV